MRVTIPARNNFDLLRFCLAFTVFLGHSFYLSGASQLVWFDRYLSGEIAVKSFFAVSGFLIFMSYENARSKRQYFEKRIRRIAPAYVTVVIAAFIGGSIIGELSFADYWQSASVYKYLLANLMFLNFLHPDLPGVFAHNQLTAVNGALWTLKIEVMFYLLVPLLVRLFKYIGYARGLFAVFVCSWCYALVMERMALQNGGGIYIELQRQLPGQLMYFIGGAALYYYFPQATTRWKWLLVVAILSWFIPSMGLPSFVQPIAIAILVVCFACWLPYLGNFGKYGDFSYGVYIVHYPILQFLIARGAFHPSPWLGLLESAGLLMLVAYLLWHGIEKPFLRRSSHYVSVNH